jgi:hypothetical protein
MWQEVEGEQNREDKIGEACSAHGREEINTKFWSENLKERDHSEDLEIRRYVGMV